MDRGRKLSFKNTSAYLRLLKKINCILNIILWYFYKKKQGFSTAIIVVI